jgi:hypothetical protein
LKIRVVDFGVCEEEYPKLSPKQLIIPWVRERVRTSSSLFWCRCGSGRCGLTHAWGSTESWC